MEVGPKQKRVVRIVAISDTHDNLQKFTKQMFPPADIFIHAGDITNWSTAQQFQRFRIFLQQLPYKHKIVIGGNHDFGLQSTQQSYEEKFSYFNLTEDYHVDCAEQIRKLREVCTYIEHDYVEVQGVKIFASPYIESSYIQGFYVDPRSGYQLWRGLPENLDVLVTHMPPFQILDEIVHGKRNIGSKRLREAVERVKPKVHIFGHIHESYGHVRIGNTDFYNVAVLDQTYTVKNKPTLIEFQL